MRILAILMTAIAAMSQTPTENHDLGYKNTPMLPGLPFHVHDPDRPRPSVVTPAAQIGGAPSDAIVLFDGKDFSKWTSANRSDPKSSTTEPPSWNIEKGYMEVVPGKGDIATKEQFGDVQLHIEWASPAVVKGTSQGRGNSGVFLQKRFEVQVLDSFENPTYADGQAGAIYGQWPLVNAARKPGEWQAYDIVFEAPHFEGEKLLKPAFLTVFHNGVLVQYRREVMGPTMHQKLATYVPQPAEDSLLLQNHGNPVRYRNIWIRKIKIP